MYAALRKATVECPADPELVDTIVRALQSPQEHAAARRAVADELIYHTGDAAAEAAVNAVYRHLGLVSPSGAASRQ